MTRVSVVVLQRHRDGNPVVAALIRAGYRVEFTGTIAGLLSASGGSSADVAIVENLPGVGWLESTSLLRRVNPQINVILLATGSSEALAIQALRAQFDDYVALPCDPKDVVAAVQRCVPRRESLRGGGAQTTSPALVGESVAISRVREEIGKLGPSEGNVLITGETGTGKELVAELIHAVSPRGAGPFVSVNCAAVPDALLESELFGYERGAFTSAEVATAGRLEDAHGGTVFLDEIGDMTLAGQAKILRVTDGKEWSRLGGRRQIRADLRFVAATNQDLDALMASGRFRRDLYYRVNVARIELLPLRNRREDVPLLLEHYIRIYNDRLECAVEGLTGEALAILTRYDWPGNVRELRNVVETMFVGKPSGRIGVELLPPGIGRSVTGTVPADAERERLLGALTATRWNKSRAAEQLRWSRMTLYRKMLKYGVPHDAA